MLSYSIKNYEGPTWIITPKIHAPKINAYMNLIHINNYEIIRNSNTNESKKHLSLSRCVQWQSLGKHFNVLPQYLLYLFKKNGMKYDGITNWTIQIFKLGSKSRFYSEKGQKITPMTYWYLKNKGWKMHEV